MICPFENVHKPEKVVSRNVTYTLSVDVTVPLISVFKRRAEQAIMDIALKALKGRVEGGG